jgi:hypothetical protein
MSRMAECHRVWYNGFMATKKISKVVKKNPNPSWVETYSISVNNRNVESGTEVSICGHRGRYRFIKHVKTSKAEWIDVIGGPRGHEIWRSFKIEQIKTVHYKNKTASNLIKERKLDKQESKF